MSVNVRNAYTLQGSLATKFISVQNETNKIKSKYMINK